MSWRVTQENVVCRLLGAVLPLQSGCGEAGVGFPLNISIGLCTMRKRSGCAEVALFSELWGEAPKWGPWGKHPSQLPGEHRAQPGKCFHGCLWERKEGTCCSPVPASASSHGCRGPVAGTPFLWRPHVGWPAHPATACCSCSRYLQPCAGVSGGFFLCPGCTAASEVPAGARVSWGGHSWCRCSWS